MNIGVQKKNSTVKDELVNVINDFSHYLFLQEKGGNTFIEISDESLCLLNKWKNNRQSQATQATQATQASTVPITQTSTKQTSIDQMKERFFFQGSEKAQVFILDSEPNFFRGESGKLLIKILFAMRLDEQSVFICNASNLNAVSQKIKTISPKVIITLGTKAGQLLLKNEIPLKQFRGKFHDFQGIKVMPTFHPALLLKNLEYKRPVWDDMQKVMKYAKL